MPKTRPRDIGTAAESAVLRVLRTAFPSAERSPLRGSKDQGDIMNTPFVWEVKGGHAAEDASAGQVLAWLGETEVEAENHFDSRSARGQLSYGYGFLITKRKGKGMASAGDWWAHLWSDDLASIVTDGMVQAKGRVPLRMTLDDLLSLLRSNGYAEAGDPPSA